MRRVTEVYRKEGRKNRDRERRERERERENVYL